VALGFWIVGALFIAVPLLWALAHRL
jgi:hypothetical protein